MVLGERAYPRLAVPALPPRHVPRPRLLAALDGALALPLAVLSAGPGAGKTVLLTDWARRQAAPVAWIAVTPADAAPRRFWRLLRSKLRALAEPAGAPAAAPPGDEAGLVRSLLGGLPGFPQAPIVVIDDAHLLTHRGVLDGLDALLRDSSPLRLHLVLAARGDPALPLHRYRLAGQLRELRAAELAMTRDEARDLLLAHGVTLGEPDFETLLACTEGWAAGLRLYATRMEGAPHPSRVVSELAFGYGSIGEYLQAEVLDRQPEPVRRLLIHTSFLDEVTGPLADAVTGLDGSAELLAALARNNSFVVPLDSTWTRFRYHRLFAEVLRHHLRRQPGRVATGLMLRAAGYFESSGDLRSALLWAARAGDRIRAASLLTRGGLAEAFASGEDPARLGALQYIQLTEDADQAAAAELAVAGSAAAAIMADPDTARRELQVRTRPGREPPADPDLQITLALSELLLGLKAGDGRAVDMAVGRLLAQRDRSSADRIPGLPAAVLLAQASTHLWHGRNQDVDALLRRALTAAKRDSSLTLELAALAMIALVDSLLSRPQHAQDAGARAYALLQQHPGLTVPPALDLAAATRALMAADFTGTDRALQRAQPGGAGAFAPGLADAQVVGQATLLLAAGDPGGARALLDSWVPQLDLPVLRVLCDTLLADIHTALGRPHAALQLLRRCGDGELSILLALPFARAFVSTHDLGRARSYVRSVLTSTSTLISRYILAEAMLYEAHIARLQSETGRALEMISGSIELAQDDIVLPFFHLYDVFAPLLARHPAIAAAWPQPSAGRPADTLLRQQRAAGELRDPLTEREQAVLRFLATSLSASEIADEMCLSVNTVKTHMAAIYRKLTVSKRKEAVLRARELELL